MRRVRKQRSYKRLIWLSILLTAMAAVAMAYSFFGHGLSRFLGGDGRTPPEVQYVMLLGVDSRADDSGRSDTLMVTAVDMQKHRAALLSIPRDTRVEIEGNGADKINHAYAYGGEELTQKTVEHLLGVKMDHYILVRTGSFADIIDALGGVDLDVEKRMYYEDPWDDNGGLVIDLYPGEQHLDGEQAIQYVRYRDGEGDIGRIKRQQKFMRAVLDQVVSPEILPRLPQLVKEIWKTVETDMSVADFLQFANLMKDVHDSGLSAQMAPGRPAYLQDISYWIPDITEVRALLPQALGLEISEQHARLDQEAEDKYLSDLPTGMNLGEKADRLSDEKEPDEEKQESGRTEREKPDADERNESKTDREITRKEKTDREREAAEQPDRAMKPEEISVLIINESGINGAGAEIADILREKGFVITNVETGLTSSREQTTITTSSRNTDVFYGMPFPCLIMDGGGSDQAVIRIGTDYRK